MAHELYVDYLPVINGTTLTQSFDVQPSHNLSRMDIRQSGKLDPVAFRTAFAEPQLAVSTFNIEQVLKSGAGNLNVNINTGLNGTAGNTVAQFQQAADGGGFQTGSNHATATSPRSFAHVESIRAQQDENQPASLRLLLSLLRSGTTNPNVFADSAAITGTISLGTIYALGKVFVNDVAYGGIQSIEYVTGIVTRPKRESGEIFADTIRIAARDHQLRLGVEEFATLEAQGFGLSSAPGAVDFYLRKISTSGGRVADATAEHIKISFSSAMFHFEEIRGSGDDGEAQTVPTLLNTGTVSVDLASAIP